MSFDVLRPWLLLAICTFAPLAARADDRPVLEIAEAVATDEASMQAYTEQIQIIPGQTATFDMVPIPGGTFLMGSPEDEADRAEDEGPVHEVEISPFWMQRCEVSWDTYDVFMNSLDIQRRELLKFEATERDLLADAVARPTKPYTDMTFGMGKAGYPAICMTQTAAKEYCNWISAKTGRYYRLPTEAEWEYACRAGTQTAYSFGDDAEELAEYAWYYDGEIEGYQKIGLKKPNPWGLYDMHGNVAEWTLDQYSEAGYPPGKAANPFVEATTIYPRAVRGGSWDDDPEMLRSAARRGSTNDWKQQDPQLPQSIWYHTDALFLGFRVVRPLDEPSEAEKARFGLDHAQQTQPREE